MWDEQGIERNKGRIKEKERNREREREKDWYSMLDPTILMLPSNVRILYRIEIVSTHYMEYGP